MMPTRPEIGVGRSPALNAEPCNTGAASTSTLSATSVIGPIL